MTDDEASSIRSCFQGSKKKFITMFWQYQYKNKGTYFNRITVLTDRPHFLPPLHGADRVRKVWNSNSERKKKHAIKRKLFSLPILPPGCFIKYHCIFNQIMILPMSRTMAFSLLYVFSGGRVG